MSNLGFGLWITVVGMGTVFALLLLLLLMLRIIGWADQRPDRRRVAPPSVPAQASEPKPGSEGLTPEEVAAITVAVITHARVRRGQAAPVMREVQPGSQLFASRWVAVGRSYQNQPWKPR